MKVLRTPGDRFEGLEGDDVAPHYSEIEDADGTRLRLHHTNDRRRAALAVMPQRSEDDRLAASPAPCGRGTRTAPSTPETST